MQVFESAGDTLAGAIDGSNTLFRTSLPFDADSLQVYVNGLLKVLDPEYVDGADVLDAHSVQMREVLLPGDTLTVAYSPAGQGSFGGQAGGVPPAAQLCVDAPSSMVFTPAPAAQQPSAQMAPPPFCAC